MNVFWAKGYRLWHAMEDDVLVALCGKTVPSPRVIMKETVPDDDGRCARCDKMVQQRSMGQ
jgi:hypothetical protein